MMDLPFITPVEQEDIRVMQQRSIEAGEIRDRAWHIMKTLFIYDPCFRKMVLLCEQPDKKSNYALHGDLSVENILLTEYGFTIQAIRHFAEKHGIIPNASDKK